MLFTFTYISNEIEKLQEYLDFLFFDVWCNANGDFDYTKLEDNEDLQKIYVDFHNTESEWGNFFNSSIENIYAEFLELDAPYREALKQGYANNNNIEGLCTDKNINPVTYDDIKTDHPTLSKELKYFYSKLYGSSSPFNLKVFGFLNKKLLPEYDQLFMKENNLEVCPFCCINHLKGNNHSYREAYDHYIPKGLYPFNVLNFKNLAPMCNECNSTYKLTEVPIYKEDPQKIDPLHKANNRSLAFYPYAENHEKINFKLELKNKNILTLKPEEIEFTIEATNCSEQIESWKRVFGVEERYKALLCSPNEGITWYKSVAEEFENAKELSDIKDADDYYKIVVKDANKSPLSSYGFLKGIFLEECKRIGAFEIKPIPV